MVIDFGQEAWELSWAAVRVEPCGTVCGAVVVGRPLPLECRASKGEKRAGGPGCGRSEGGRYAP